MAKLMETDAAIERIIKDKRQHLIEAERRRLERERDHTIELNHDLRKEDRKPIPDVDREMGVYEADLDRRLAMLDSLAKKNCKAFKEDASKYGDAVDFDALTMQSVEAALYGNVIYFSNILGRNKRAVL